MNDKYTTSGAVISGNGRYRYRLWREWSGTYAARNWRRLGFKDGAGVECQEPLSCVFVMLNPSTADAQEDDPTIRKCVAFAKSINYSRLDVVNLFAYRATSPKVLLALGHADDPVGWENQRQVGRAVAGAGVIICAWGAHGGHLNQDETMLGWLSFTSTPVMCLGKLTKQGHPPHPLYLRGDTPLLDYRSLISL
jgi:hypothetical protein